MAVKLIKSYEETVDGITYIVEEYQSDKRTEPTIVKTPKPTEEPMPEPKKPPLPDISTTDKKLDFIIKELGLKNKYKLP